MDRKGDILFGLLRAALQNRKPEGVAFDGLGLCEWNELICEASKQGVEALLFDVVERCGEELMVPPQAFVMWSVAAEKCAQNYSFKGDVAVELNQLFEREGLSMVVLKGLGMCALYRNPAARRFSDIDIWFRGGGFERADRVAAERLGVEVCGNKHHHTTWRYRGVLVENHFDFLNLYDHHSNRPIEEVLQQLARRDGSTIRVVDSELRVPCADFALLFAYRHAATHFAGERIGLRHLADLEVLTSSVCSLVDWQLFCNTCRKAGMMPFVECVWGILIDRLGMDSGAVPRFERRAELEQLIVDDIIAPRFAKRKPRGLVGSVVFKLRRYRSNRWKHGLVFSESWIATLFRSSWSHLLKPDTIKM